MRFYFLTESRYEMSLIHRYLSDRLFHPVKTTIPIDQGPNQVVIVTWLQVELVTTTLQIYGSHLNAPTLKGPTPSDFIRKDLHILLVIPAFASISRSLFQFYFSYLP